jgi:hypothetical protein
MGEMKEGDKGMKRTKEKKIRDKDMKSFPSKFQRDFYTS